MNKLQWNSSQNTKLFILENASESTVCKKVAILSRGRWVNKIVGQIFSVNIFMLYWCVFNVNCYNHCMHSYIHQSSCMWKFWKHLIFNFYFPICLMWNLCFICALFLETRSKLTIILCLLVCWTLIPAWISNYIHFKVWYEISYIFQT